MTETIDTTGLNRADVLRVLYNRAKPQGMGFMHYTPEDMTQEQAQSILDQMDDGERARRENIRDHRGPDAVLSEFKEADLKARYFDYLKGRVMKVDVAPDHIDPWGFDRDNGQGAAAGAIEALRVGV